MNIRYDTNGVLLTCVACCVVWGDSVSSSYASSNVFVLLSWCCSIYSECLSINPDFPSTSSWNVLLGAFATLIGILLDNSAHTKPAVRKSALVRTRRALRSVRTIIYLPLHLPIVAADARDSLISILNICTH